MDLSGLIFLTLHSWARAFQDRFCLGMDGIQPKLLQGAGLDPVTRCSRHTDARSRGQYLHFCFIWVSLGEVVPVPPRRWGALPRAAAVSSTWLSRYSSVLSACVKGRAVYWLSGFLMLPLPVSESAGMRLLLGRNRSRCPHQCSQSTSGKVSCAECYTRV